MKTSTWIVALVAGPFAFLFSLILGIVFLTSSSAIICGPSVKMIDPGRIDSDAVISRYGHDQLVNAAYIMNAASALNMTRQAQIIGVAVAAAESGLVVLDHGDTGCGGTSRGLFQQCDNGAWGSLDDRMNPTTSATNFFKALLKISDWEALAPTAAAHAVQGNEDPNFYTPFVDVASQIVTALNNPTSPGATGTPGNSAGTCGVPIDTQTLAKELMIAVDQGKLTGGSPDHIQEIRWLAEGQKVPNCGVDGRILQVLVIAIHNFETVAISDINRLCTNQIEGAGTQSTHYINEGGHAVDIYRLNGNSLTGADPFSLKLINLLDPVMPTGSGLGQLQCRANVEHSLANFVEFNDTCTHLHIDVGHTDQPLKIN